MAIEYGELDLQEIFSDLGEICITEKVCGCCADKACIIGYAKDCASRCRQTGVTYVEKGTEVLPADVTAGEFDEYEVLHAISHLLVQCRSCKTEHYDNCIISVLRNCMELIAFGKTMDYEGIPLRYLMNLAAEKPGRANIIMQEYRERKKAGEL